MQTLGTNQTPYESKDYVQHGNSDFLFLCYGACEGSHAAAELDSCVSNAANNSMPPTEQDGTLWDTHHAQFRH